MSFFAKGDFKIQSSWGEQKQKQRIGTSSKQKRQKSSILSNAAKNIFEPPPTHEILDDKLAKKILNQFNYEKQAIQKKNSQQKDPTSSKQQHKLPPKQKNQDILSSMANRLSKLELTCANQRSELKQKNQTIQKLQKQNQLMKSIKQNPNSVITDLKKIEQQNTKLKQKVSQMEAFLKTYGLKWTGSKVEGKFDQQKLKKDMQKPKYNYNLPSQIDINVVVRRINQLNLGLHQQGSGTQVYKDRDGLHKFRKAEPLLVGFYQDGIAIKGYNFYTYKSKESMQILADLLDGYFPYILKAKYPNGVFLKVLDKTDEKYNLDKSQKINTFQTAEQKQLKPASKEQFLQKLPKQIIKNGKVIDIRGAIEKKFDGIKQINNENNIDLISQIDGILTFKTLCQTAFVNNQISQNDICTLKVRTQSGKIVMLRLYPQQFMKDIYYWMKMVSQSKDFIVVGNYPKRQYPQDLKQNLEELGLIPNSALHLQSLNQIKSI